MTIVELKQQYRDWSGFELEANNLEDIINEIKGRQWQMECDLNAQAKGLIKKAESIFKEQLHDN